ARNDINNMHIFDAGGVNGRAFLRPGDNFSAASWVRTDIGVWDICIAPTNSDYIYAIYNGEFWHTSDNAATVAKRSSFTRDTNLNHTDAFRAYGNRMRVDPADPLIVGVMDMTGLKYSLDGGATWTQHADIPSWATNLWGCIEFGRGGGTTSGRTSNVFVAV